MSHGGGKLLQSAAGIAKAGASAMRQAAVNAGNAGLKPLAVGGYGTSVSGWNNINAAIQQAGKSGAQIIAANASMQNVPAGGRLLRKRLHSKKRYKDLQMKYREPQLPAEKKR